MANCINCSAPLPTDSLICLYCGTRNNPDLKEVHRHTTQMPTESRTCPGCDATLTTVNVGQAEVFLIEKCDACGGLFFDPGELPAYLDKKVEHVYRVQSQRLQEIRKHNRTTGPVQYRKCPVCGKVMNRVNFGRGSGAIVDQCREHGVWLDAGELSHILEWKKAGGQIAAERVQKIRDEQRFRQEKERKKRHKQRMGDARQFESSEETPFLFQSRFQSNSILENGLAKAVSRVLNFLF